jgi:hypothetical protein
VGRLALCPFACDGTSLTIASEERCNPWLYFRFTLSFRDVEELLAERGITVSYETVRRWVNHFGPMVAVKVPPTEVAYRLPPQW